MGNDMVTARKMLAIKERERVREVKSRVLAFFEAEEYPTYTSCSRALSICAQTVKKYVKQLQAEGHDIKTRRDSYKYIDVPIERRLGTKHKQRTRAAKLCLAGKLTNAGRYRGNWTDKDLLMAQYFVDNPNCTLRDCADATGLCLVTVGKFSRYSLILSAELQAPDELQKAEKARVQKRIEELWAHA